VVVLVIECGIVAEVGVVLDSFSQMFFFFGLFEHMVHVSSIGYSAGRWSSFWFGRYSQ